MDTYIPFNTFCKDLNYTENTIISFLRENKLIKLHKTGTETIWKRHYPILMKDSYLVDAVYKLTVMMHTDSSFHDRLFVIRRGINTQTFDCIICGNKTKFNGRHMSSVCSVECFHKQAKISSNTKSAQNKKKLTMKERYGTEYIFQSEYFDNLASKSRIKRKKFILENGNIWYCQGYEPQMLTILQSQGYNLSESISKFRFEYMDDEIKRIHICDIYIPKENRIIEVKSSWTITLNPDKIFKKQNEAKKLGYGYEIWVLEKSGEILKIYK